MMKVNVRVAVLAVSILVAVPAQAAIFMEYEGVKGETTKGATPEREVAPPRTSATSGGVNVATGDVTGDGSDDLVGATVPVRDTGDLDGDGMNDVVVGTPGASVKPVTGSPNTDGNENWDFEGGVSVGKGGTTGKPKDARAVTGDPDFDLLRSAGGASTGTPNYLDMDDDGDAISEIERGGGVKLIRIEMKAFGEDERRALIAVAPTSSAAVATESDLRHFIVASASSTPDITDVEFSSSSLSVTYVSPGRFLGLIPVSVSHTVTLQPGEGEEVSATVRRSWFGFLTRESTPADDVIEALGAAKGKKKPKPEPAPQIDSYSWGVTEHARMFSTISNVLKTKHDTVKNSINNVR